MLDILPLPSKGANPANHHDYEKGEQVMQNEQNAVTPENARYLPLQAAPVMRTVVNSAISSDAGVEASDYNDPVYFFLNWPASV